MAVRILLTMQASPFHGERHTAASLPNRRLAA